MSFINPITGNIPNNELIITETNISVENGSFENISAVNASFVNLTTTIFTPVNVNSSQISVSVLNVSTGNMSVLNISTANVSDLFIDELELINLSVDNISNDIIDTEVINIKSNNSLLPNGQLRKLNNEVILSLGDAADVGSFSIKPDGTNTKLNLTNNGLTITNITGVSGNFSSMIAEQTITDGLYIKEQSVVLTDQSLIKRDANEVMFIGKSDAGDVTGADFVFRTGTEANVVKLLIPRSSNVVEVIALYATTTIEGDTGIFNAIGVSDLTVADTTTLGELEVLTSASIKNLNVIGPNGLTAAKAGITNCSITNLSGTTITASTIKGNLSVNLAAGAGINLSTVGGVTTITNTGLVTSPLSVSVINASTINTKVVNVSSITASGTILAKTLTGNVGGNLVSGAGINLSTNIGTGITTITNTGIITDPLNLSTLNASIINVSLLNAPNIEGFTQSTEYAFRASSTSGGQTLAGGDTIDFDLVQLETPPPVYVSGFVDKGFNPILKQYLIPTSGIYAFGFNMYYNNANYTLRIGIYKNGVLIASGGNNSSTADSVTTVVDCAEGEWINIKVVNGSGSTVPSNCSFWGYKLIPANNLITSTTNMSIQNLSVADDMSVTNMSVSNISTSYLTGINASISSIYINASAKIAVVNTSQLNVSNMSGNVVTINSLNAYYSESEYVYFTNNAFGAPGTANAQPGIVFKYLEELQIRSGSVAFPGNIHFTRDGTTTNMIYDGNLNISSKANISNISSTNLTIATALTGAGNINITGDISAGIISGATLTGDISGNLLASTGISLATAGGVTTITNTLPYVEMGYLSLSRTTNYTPGSGISYWVSYNTAVSNGSADVSYSFGPNYEININTTGRYVISGSGSIDNTAYNGRIALRIRLNVNGNYLTTYPQAYGYARLPTEVPEATASYTDFVIDLVAGNIVKNRLDITKGTEIAWNSSFSNVNIAAGCNCMIRRIS